MKNKKVDLDEYFKNFLNDNHPPIIIFDKYKYKLGDVLKNIDPTLFRIASLDYLDSMLCDDQWIEIDGEIYEK